VGYFLLQLYIPCTLIVFLSWVGLWLNREATNDRINLGVTTVLTLIFVIIEGKKDLPQVSYITALDCFLAVCFIFVFSTLFEFALVHYCTKARTGDLNENMRDLEDYVIRVMSTFRREKFSSSFTSSLIRIIQPILIRFETMFI
jgi:gamma-aminobutyric acid receptor subunit alpha